MASVATETPRFTSAIARSYFRPPTVYPLAGEESAFDASLSEEAPVIGELLRAARRLQAAPQHGRHDDRFGQEQDFLGIAEDDFPVVERQVIAIDRHPGGEAVLTLERRRHLNAGGTGDVAFELQHVVGAGVDPQPPLDRHRTLPVE